VADREPQLNEESLNSLFKHDNLEARLHADSKTIEIVQWFDVVQKHCIVIAFVRAEGDDIDINFVGSRPFDSRINSSVFWSILKFSSSVMSALISLRESLEERD
jgi:hypothetical protein